MGVLLKWKKITTEASYDQVRVYRANDEDATYSLITTQTVEDNSYYDGTGNESHWYKIEFYNSVTGNVSERSDPIQGGTFYGYCTVDEVRQTTNLKSNNISDTQLASLIEFAGSQLNADINMYNEEERIRYIDETKENDIDGMNSTFYTKEYPIGDANDDFKITTDDLTVYKVDSDGNKEEMEVTQVNAETGQFRTLNAPSQDKKLYVTYYHTNRRVDLPHNLIKMACILLTAAWAYSKINIGKADRFHMGNLTVFRDTDSYHEYYKKYLRVLELVNDRTIADIEEAENLL